MKTYPSIYLRRLGLTFGLFLLLSFLGPQFGLSYQSWKGSTYCIQAVYGLPLSFYYRPCPGFMNEFPRMVFDWKFLVIDILFWYAISTIIVDVGPPIIAGIKKKYDGSTLITLLKPTWFKIILTIGLFTVFGLWYGLYSSTRHYFTLGFPWEIYADWSPCSTPYSCKDFYWDWLLQDFVFWYLISIILAPWFKRQRKDRSLQAI